MAFITLEDINGSVEVVIFPKVYAKYANLLEENRVVLVNGRTQVSVDGDTKIICEDIHPYEELEDTDKTIWIRLPADRNINAESVMPVLMRSRGTSKVIIYDEKTRPKMSVRPQYYVKPSEELVSALTELCGSGNVVVK